MGREVWGTFSVKDHCEPNAFVAEVMLYDRLVIPRPPDEAETARWQAEGWQPDRLDELLAILGDRAYVVDWDAERQRSWSNRFRAGTDIAQATGDWAFAATRTELTSRLPRNVTGVQAVTHYMSEQELWEDLRLRPTQPGEIPLYGGTAVAVLAHEFLVPNDFQRGHADLLKDAVELSSDKASSRKRAAFWRWQREFMDDKGITDETAVRDAVEEMHDLIEEEKAVIRRKWIRTGSQFAFLVGSVALGMIAGPLSAVAIGGAFVSVGQFVSDKFFESQAPGEVKPVALLRDIQKHFGWQESLNATHPSS
jgi:hypothetical protein